MFTALTSVMVPRVSVALKSNDNSEAKEMCIRDRHKIVAKYIAKDFVTMRTGGASNSNVRSRLTPVSYTHLQ